MPNDEIQRLAKKHKIPQVSWCNFQTKAITPIEGQYLFDPVIYDKVVESLKDKPFVQTDGRRIKKPTPSRKITIQKPPPAKREKTLMIYAIEHGASRQVKLGFTHSLTQRLSGLQLASPAPLTLLSAWKVPDARRVEELLHKRFAAKNVRGEWFYLSLEDEADLIAFMSDYEKIA